MYEFPSNRTTKEPPKNEQVSAFHFREIAELEPAFISLAEQLKSKIENSSYDTLISDDVGGRIPSLIFHHIIKILNRKDRSRTIFIASGKTYLPTGGAKREKLEAYLRSQLLHAKSVLLITQYVFTGKTLVELARAIQSIGITKIDVAIVDAMPHFEERTRLDSTVGANHIFIGSQDWHAFHEEHDRFSGVRKSKKIYSPFPRRETDVIQEEGRELSHEEWKEIFGIERYEPPASLKRKTSDPEKNRVYEERVRASLTPEEVVKMKETTRFAREDAKLLAKRVVEQVWGRNF